jgi:alkylhydroperoxidase family enzyme
MTVKTDYSRFDIHDELTAPEETARLLRGMSDAGGSVSKFVGVLAGSPAAMRGFAKMRHELRGGVLPRPTAERIALAVAERRGDTYSVAQHARTAKAAGLGLDEISRARSWNSNDPREAALLAFLQALFDADLTLLYSTTEVEIDRRFGVVVEAIGGPVDIRWKDNTLPIYGRAAHFSGQVDRGALVAGTAAIHRGP